MRAWVRHGCICLFRPSVPEQRRKEKRGRGGGGGHWTPCARIFGQIRCRRYLVSPNRSQPRIFAFTPSTMPLNTISPHSGAHLFDKNHVAVQSVPCHRERHHQLHRVLHGRPQDWKFNPILGCLLRNLVNPWNCVQPRPNMDQWTINLKIGGCLADTPRGTLRLVLRGEL